MLPGGPIDRLLTVAEVAEWLSTSERFPRRLIEEGRITFVRLGRKVRIPESVPNDFISAGLVPPSSPVRGEQHEQAPALSHSQASLGAVPGEIPRP